MVLLRRCSPLRFSPSRWLFREKKSYTYHVIGMTQCRELHRHRTLSKRTFSLAQDVTQTSWCILGERSELHDAAGQAAYSGAVSASAAVVAAQTWPPGHAAKLQPAARAVDAAQTQTGPRQGDAVISSSKESDSDKNGQWSRRTLRAEKSKKHSAQRNTHDELSLITEGNFESNCVVCASVGSRLHERHRDKLRVSPIGAPGCASKIQNHCGAKISQKLQGVN
ncbi:hypothetical protein BDV95DRAFT_91333 [Massariosphaeria phaeospora]|uniref:Uncharacterized protein n=1 Tax=Massariosphaeria phaeospora TaxID=100035 RepID=A0A7C8ICS0_9PLEO|nr:hypothetical protein BDV95DRAFT_91333 [Massariosphaeria phaeospora]